MILVRKETVPDDIHGMEVAKGILTSRGGGGCQRPLLFSSPRSINCNIMSVTSSLV